MAAGPLRFQEGNTVTPGDRIGSIREISPGAGTYARGGHVYASAVGTLCIKTTTTKNTSMDEGGKDGNESESMQLEDNNSNRSNNNKSSVIVSVQLGQGCHYASSRVMKVGQIVLGRVVRVMNQQAMVEIVAAQNIGVLATLQQQHSSNPSSGSSIGSTNTILPEGVIRREDVRAGGTTSSSANSAGSKNTLSQSSQPTESMQQWFRPEDVVVCRILSLGDSRKFLLTTAETELGVVRAKCSTTGTNMVPISWKEMQCPDSHQKEPRKCAKPKNLAALFSSFEE